MLTDATGDKYITVQVIGQLNETEVLPAALIHGTVCTIKGEAVPKDRTEKEKKEAHSTAHTPKNRSGYVSTRDSSSQGNAAVSLSGRFTGAFFRDSMEN